MRFSHFACVLAWAAPCCFLCSYPNQHLFTAFGVSNWVVYGTFNKLAEVVLHCKGDVREMVSEFVTTGNVTKSTRHPVNRKRILLIDEVDVFFKQDFYGQLCVCPRHTTVRTGLLRFRGPATPVLPPSFLRSLHALAPFLRSCSLSTRLSPPPSPFCSD